MRDRLIEVARRGQTTTYSAVAPLANLNMELPNDRVQISQLLDEISRAEQQTGRPLLTVVVIRNDINMPGEGFFTLARNLAAQPTGMDNFQFFIEELRRAHDYWRNH